MYAKMDGQRITTTSNHEVSLDNILRTGVHDDPDVGALSTLGKNQLCVMVWHYLDDLIPGPDANVTLTITGLPSGLTQANVTEYRIDNNHSNAFTAWKNLGSPENPTPAQYAELVKAGQLQAVENPAGATTFTLPIVNGQLAKNISLPRQSVSLLVVDWSVPPSKIPELKPSP
jgi:xylan 1,4-beta-xylosidase